MPPERLQYELISFQYPISCQFAAVLLPVKSKQKIILADITLTVHILNVKFMQRPGQVLTELLLTRYCVKHFPLHNVRLLLYSP